MDSFVLSVLEASKKIIEHFRHGDPALYMKQGEGAGGDESLRADLLCEEIFASYLKQYGTIHSEESGEIAGTGAGILYLDPLDGSDNFASHFPYYGASIALCDTENRTQKAVIVNFCSQEVFLREDSSSEALYGHLSNPLSSYVPLASLPKMKKVGIFERAYKDSRLGERIHALGFKFRSPGAIALSLAQAHNVDFVLFRGKERIYDTKAGLFLCEGLHMLHNEGNFLLVSRDAEVFKKLAGIIN
ncbi:MAG: inositol monophosphatase family protein [Wolinella sp.]